MDQRIHLHPQSHNHLPEHRLDEALRFAEAQLGEATGVHVASGELPGRPRFTSALVKRRNGDLHLHRERCLVEAVTVLRGYRGDRRGATPVAFCFPRITRTVTVVSGPAPEDPTRRVLYTAYAGPPVPREPWDPSLAGDENALAEARAFWDEHAIAILGTRETEPVWLNATPHAITLRRPDGGEVTLEPCGAVARVAMTTRPLSGEETPAPFGVPLVDISYGGIEGLPERWGDERMRWIVSSMVLDACEARGLAEGFYAPGELVRDERGHVIACASLRAGRPPLGD